MMPVRSGNREYLFRGNMLQQHQPFKGKDAQQKEGKTYQKQFFHYDGDDGNFDDNDGNNYQKICSAQWQ